MALKLVVLTAYALIIIFVGIAGLRRTRSFSDYFLGGGKVGFRQMAPLIAEYANLQVHTVEQV